MPIYELQCVACTYKEEKFFPSVLNFLTQEEFKRKQEIEDAEFIKEQETKHPGYEVICVGKKPVNGSPYQICPACERFMELVPSLCSMQPDNMWAGVNTSQGYVTSKSRYNKSKEANGIYEVTSKSELDNIRKRASEVQKEQQEKRDEKRIKAISEHFSGIDIDNTGVYDTPSE